MEYVYQYDNLQRQLQLLQSVIPPSFTLLHLLPSSVSYHPSSPIFLHLLAFSIFYNPPFPKLLHPISSSIPYHPPSSTLLHLLPSSISNPPPFTIILHLHRAVIFLFQWCQQEAAGHKRPHAGRSVYSEVMVKFHIPHHVTFTSSCVIYLIICHIPFHASWFPKWKVPHGAWQINICHVTTC